MAGESRHHEDSWFHHVRLLCEVDQSPKRGRLDRFLADGHELSVHAHFVDAKGRPRVGVNPTRATISFPAENHRTTGSSRSAPGRTSTASMKSRATAFVGAMRSICAWYAP